MMTLFKNGRAARRAAKTIIALSLVVGAFHECIAGDVAGAVVTKLQLSRTFSDLLFIQVDRTKDVTPSCHTNAAWTYVLHMTTEEDKRIYAMLLTARVTQSPVTLSGTGTCDAFGSIESLNGAGY